MSDPTLTISISRSVAAGGPTALVLSGSDDESDLGVTDYQPPALMGRLLSMPDSADVDGTEYVAASWQQAILGFNWCADRADTEAEALTAYNEVVAAIGQFSFEVTTQVSGATAQTWSANRGSISLVGQSRTIIDLSTRRPVYSVTIPVHPIAEV